MEDYPVIESKEKLKDLFEAIRVVEIPKKVTYRYLSGIGFSSSKDRALLPLLRLLGLIDSKGAPTQPYVQLRDEQAFAEVLQRSLSHTYADVFNLDEGAQNVSENVLVGYFNKLTGKSQRENLSYANTFKNLYNLVDIPQEAVERHEALKQPIPANVSLNISLPSTTDEKVYESLFKHLRDLLGPQG